MSLIFKYSTLQLNDQANGLTVEEFELPDRTRIPNEYAPRRHGAILVEEEVLEERILLFSGTVVKSSEAALRTWLDDSLKVLNTTRQTFQLYDGTGRRITCTKADFSTRFQQATAAAVLRYECELFAADPFWYAQSATSDSRVHSNHPTSSLSYTHTNPGSALIFPTITVTANISGAISGITFNNTTTGKSWTFSGTIASGKALVVDCANLTVTNDGVNALSSWSGIFTWLLSGSNSITFSGGNATVLISYTARSFGP